jgi:hypothetical protein
MSSEKKIFGFRNNKYLQQIEVDLPNDDQPFAVITITPALYNSTMLFYTTAIIKKFYENSVKQETFSNDRIILTLDQDVSAKEFLKNTVGILERNNIINNDEATRLNQKFTLGIEKTNADKILARDAIPLGKL